MICNLSDIQKIIKNQPSLILASPNFKTIGILGNYKNLHMEAKLLEKSTLTFELPQYFLHEVTKEIVENSLYNKIKKTLLVHILGAGWFYIEDVVEKCDGFSSTLSVIAYSYEHTLTLRSVNLYSNISESDSQMNLNMYEICTALQKQTGWAYPYFSSELHKYYASFNKNLNTSWYEFLVNTVQSSIGIIVLFDIENLGIELRFPEALDGNKSQMILSYDNFLKNIEIKKECEKIPTALSVIGQDFDISDVNPLGSVIYNFEPYKTTEWMSQGLIAAINKWEEKANSYRSTYKNLCGYRNYLIQLKLEVKAELAETETQLKSIANIMNASGELIGGDYSSKNGQNYRIYLMKQGRLNDYLSFIKRAYSIVTEGSDVTNCRNSLEKMVVLHENIPPAYIIKSGSSNYSFSEFIYGSNSITEKTYCYSNINFLESDGLEFNMLAINGNYFGNEIKNTSGSIPNIPTIQKTVSFAENFTKAQLSELRPFIVDATYQNSNLSYYTANSYTNYINPWSSEYDCIQSSRISGNVYDQFVYGVNNWTTDFIPLPQDGLSLKFYNKHSGETIQPKWVGLYSEDKNSCLRLIPDENVTNIWNSTYGGKKYYYIRASFSYSPSKYTPIDSIACGIGYTSTINKNIDNAQILMDEGIRAHKELVIPCTSFSASVNDFLNEAPNEVVNTLGLGSSLKCETLPEKYETIRLLGMSIDFGIRNDISLEFANKQDASSDKVIFRKLIGMEGNTSDIQNSFTSFSYDDNKL